MTSTPDPHEFLITQADAGELVARAATIHDAQRAVRDLILAGHDSLVVTVPTGTIYLDEPVVFTREDTPQAAGSVTWRAAEPGRTRIFGGRLIAANWAQRPDGTQQATIATGLDFDELFIDGKRQTLARYPSYTESEILQGTAADALSAERVGSWSNPAEGRVRALHKYE